jgi:hypothetical protein
MAGYNLLDDLYNRGIAQRPLGSQFTGFNAQPGQVGFGVLKPGYAPVPKQTVVAPSSPKPTPAKTPAKSASKAAPAPDPNAAIKAAQAKANADAKARSDRENANTRALADQQHALLGSFATARDTKLGNIARAFQSSDALMLKNYGDAVGGLNDQRKQNDMAESDSSFQNIANAVRERASLADQAASLGAGETDILRAQLQALRNYANNQSEISRSYFDTNTSVNNSVNALNRDTATQRTNLYNQAESDRESAWANFANQSADAWTQIMNIENANNNVATDSSDAYNKAYANAGQEAANAVKQTYTRQDLPAGYNDWAGKAGAQNRQLTRSNVAAAVTVSGPRAKPEGATLRKWDEGAK